MHEKRVGDDAERDTVLPSRKQSQTLSVQRKQVEVQFISNDGLNVDGPWSSCIFGGVQEEQSLSSPPKTPVPFGKAIGIIGLRCQAEK